MRCHISDVRRIRLTAATPSQSGRTGRAGPQYGLRRDARAGAPRSTLVCCVPMTSFATTSLISPMMPAGGTPATLAEISLAWAFDLAAYKRPPCGPYMTGLPQPALPAYWWPISRPARMSATAIWRCGTGALPHKVEVFDPGGKLPRNQTVMAGITLAPGSPFRSLYVLERGGAYAPPFLRKS